MRVVFFYVYYYFFIESIILHSFQIRLHLQQSPRDYPMTFSSQDADWSSHMVASCNWSQLKAQPLFLMTHQPKFGHLRHSGGPAGGRAGGPLQRHLLAK